jgi:polyferredoxin
MKRAVNLRRISQASFFFIFISILWSTAYPLNGLLPSDAPFKADPLLTVMTSVSERAALPGLALAGLMIGLTFCLGRFFCGWVCPLGTAIDAAGVIREKGLVLSDAANKKARLPKFIILAVISLAALAGIQTAWVLDPMVITARFISLKGPFLGARVYSFSPAGAIPALFLVITASALLLRRAWCRSACPLGALYAVAGRFSLLARRVSGCGECGRCKGACRMGAIRDDLGYEKGECVLCMDCVYDCPKHAARFTLPAWRGRGPRNDNKGMTRREFLLTLGFSSISLIGTRKAIAAPEAHTGNVIRPPAALKEGAFLNRCVRCGNCMKVCITNGLQPAFLESGAAGIWTPRLVPEIGYCEYDCTLCGTVCPTGAIPTLDIGKKRAVKLGTARVDRAKCIAWARNAECIVCEKCCPIPEKAVKLTQEKAQDRTILKPYVNRRLCVGCGVCQKVCPARPERAIKVDPGAADRT